MDQTEAHEFFVSGEQKRPRESSGDFNSQTQALRNKIANKN